MLLASAQDDGSKQHTQMIECTQMGRSMSHYISVVRGVAAPRGGAVGQEQNLVDPDVE